MNLLEIEKMIDTPGRKLWKEFGDLVNAVDFVHMVPF